MGNLIELKKDNIMKKIEIKELIKGQMTEQVFIAPVLKK